MSVKYPIQVDPATVVLHLCLQVEPKSHVTSDDVMKEVLSARGSSDRYPPRRYRIDKIRDMKLGLIVDEGQHEIDIGEFERTYGCDVATKALQGALSARARVEAGEAAWPRARMVI